MILHGFPVFWAYRITAIFINNKHLGIEIDPELHYKLHYISKYYGRSANGEILYLIRQEIKAFEKSEGTIEVPQTPNGN